MSGVFRTIDPPPPLHPASVSSPRRAVRGWGSIFRKTPVIGLASYSIIPLRCKLRVGIPILASVSRLKVTAFVVKGIDRAQANPTQGFLVYTKKT